MLYILKPQEYVSDSIRILKDLTREHVVIYVTSNKPYSSAVKLFKSESVSTDNMFFIDCISKRVGEPPDEGINNVVMLESPENLTSLSIAITESINKIEGKKALFMDSLSTLALFNDVKVLEKFSQYIINKMSLMDCEMAILTLEDDTNKTIIDLVSSIVDKVVKM